MAYLDENKKKKAALNQKKYPAHLKESEKNVPGGLNLSERIDSTISKVKDYIVEGFKSVASSISGYSSIAAAIASQINAISHISSNEDVSG